MININFILSKCENQGKLSRQNVKNETNYLVKM